MLVPAGDQASSLESDNEYDLDVSRTVAGLSDQHRSALTSRLFLLSGVIQKTFDLLAYIAYDLTMKLCTESTYCPAAIENICDRFENEPSEIGERGQIIGTGYCIHCGHSRECHED